MTRACTNWAGNTEHTATPGGPCAPPLVLAGLRDGAIDPRVDAQVVKGTGEDRHHGRAGLGAGADGPAVVAALPGREGADDQPYEEQHRPDAHPTSRGYR